jgi:hypothetical protein
LALLLLLLLWAPPHTGTRGTLQLLLLLKLHAQKRQHSFLHVQVLLLQCC